MRRRYKIILTTGIALLVIGSIVSVFSFAKRDAVKPEYIWDNSKAYDESKNAELTMSSNQFKILNITDIQMENNYYLRETKKMLTDLINETHPDLITMTGDNVAGFFTFINQKIITNFMDSFNIPWAPVFGNHDEDGRASEAWLGKVFLEAQNCLFQYGPTNITGDSNYLINIKKDNHYFFSLYMLDSNRYSSFLKYAPINESQIAWYEDNIHAINNKEDETGHTIVPSFCFFHIPLIEYKTAYEEYKKGEIQGTGENREEISCSKQNTGFFDKVKELNSTKMIMVGHDHTNNSILEYQGITLAYGLKSSKYCYADNDMIGGTLITISEDSTFTIEHIYK